MMRGEWVAAAAAIIAYANILPNDFCYDDVPIVQFNDLVNEPGQWLSIWTTDYWSQSRDASPDRDLLYRPLAVTSYRVVRTIAGPHPLAQHALNVLLHAVVAALVVRLCRRIGLSEMVSLAAGLLFAVHPIHSEVVAGVVGRADILAAMGVLLALLSHHRSMPAVSRSAMFVWRVAAALSVFVAMGAKENGVCVLPLIALWDALQTKSPSNSGRYPAWWSWGTLRRLLYLVLPTAGYFALRYYALEGHLYQRPALTKTINVLVDAPPWQHVLGVLQLWGMYWAKTFWPSVLCVNYSINAVRLATNPLDPHVLLGLLVTVGLIIAAAIAWRKNVRTFALLAAAVVVSYAPTANAFVLVRVFFAERVWYLPSVFACVLIAIVVLRILRWRIGKAIGIALLFVLAVRGWVRNTEWRNNGTLYAAAYRDHPDAVGCLQLYGQWLADHGAYDEAVDLLNRAIEIDLGYTDAHRILGQAHLRAGQWPLAVHHLQLADMQVPGHPPTVAALERAGIEVSRIEQGELSRLLKAAEERKGVESEVAVIRKMREMGMVREALDRLRAGDSYFSSSAAWQSEYAVTLVYLNDLDRAIDRYRRAIDLAPNDVQRMVELAMLLLERRKGNDLNEAWELSTQASRLAPDAPHVLICRAELLALHGDLRGAAAAYQEAMRGLPSESEQRRAIEQRAKALGN